MVSQSYDLPNTLVIGLGNPILGDDGLGWIVAQQIKEFIDSPEVEIVRLACGGLQLMERMLGYQRVILIDTFHHTQAEPGKIFLFELDTLPASGTAHSNSSHEATLHQALQMGRSLGLELPEEITIVAVASPWTADFHEGLSAPIEASVPQVRDIVLDWLQPHLPHEAQAVIGWQPGSQP